MKTRVITAAVLIPVLLLILLAAPKIVLALVWGAMLSVAAYELLYRTGLVQHVRLVVYAAVMAFAVSMWSFFGAMHAYAVLGVLVFMAVLFGELMYDHVKITFDKICMCFVAGLLIPILLSSLVRIQTLKIGRYVILIPFIVAFAAAALMEPAVGALARHGWRRSVAAGLVTLAVLAAAADAEPGDTVLLSPACSSFDHFRNFEERGNTFKSIVNELEHRRP